jgi:ribulose-5-phosphate 4-epimerase/fuculose-1-phosphate aldolase
MSGTTSAASVGLPPPLAGEGRGEGAALRDEICRIGKSLFERRYAHATAGNISARLPDGSFLITPTDACLGHLEPEALSHVDAQGTLLSGARPSKTLAVHRRIYEADPSPAA